MNRTKFIMAMAGVVVALVLNGCNGPVSFAAESERAVAGAPDSIDAALIPDGSSLDAYVKSRQNANKPVIVTGAFQRSSDIITLGNAVRQLALPVDISNTIIPDGIIPPNAFKDCIFIPTIALPNRVAVIADKAFEGCESMKTINLPSHLISIGDSAFAYCRALPDLTFPNNLTSIGNFAFCSCKSFKNVTLPEGLTSLGYLAFDNCRKLTTISLPDTLQYIDDETFSSCDAITTLRIANNVDMSTRAFLFCLGDFRADYIASGRAAGTYHWNGTEWSL